MAGSADESEFFMDLVTSAARDGTKTTAVSRGVYRVVHATNGGRGVHRGGATRDGAWTMAAVASAAKVKGAVMDGATTTSAVRVGATKGVHGDDDGRPEGGHCEGQHRNGRPP